MQIPAEQALQVSPYTPYVYGFLVLCLLSAIVYLARTNRSLRAENERIRKEDSQYKERSLTLLVKAEERLPSAEKFEEIKGMLATAIEIIKNIQNDRRSNQ